MDRALEAVLNDLSVKKLTMRVRPKDTFLLGLGTLEASTAVLGIDNILIQGRPGVVLPGVNLLLMSE